MKYDAASAGPRWIVTLIKSENTVIKQKVEFKQFIIVNNC